MISFSSSELLDDDVAYIVENDILLHAVNTELTSTDNNVKIVYDAKIAGYQLPKQDNSTVKSYVQMSNGDTYTCQLLVSTVLLLFCFQPGNLEEIEGGLCPAMVIIMIMVILRIMYSCVRCMGHKMSGRVFFLFDLTLKEGFQLP